MSIGWPFSLFSSAFYCDVLDVFCIIDVEYAHILHALVADLREHSCLIAVDESFCIGG